MKTLLLLLLSLTTCLAYFEPPQLIGPPAEAPSRVVYQKGEAPSRVVYGQDSRIEAWPNSTPYARSVAGLAANNKKRTPCRICPDEPFVDQPQRVFCTAFLVSPHTLATAAHCVEPDSVALFDFYFNEDSPTRVPLVNVSTVRDWAFWNLSVPSRRPFLQFAQARAQLGDPLELIGHPLGLPMKLDRGGRVKRLYDNGFEASVDAFAGNSGSPILKAGRVLGMLQGGNLDFVWDSQRRCCRTRVCSESGGCPGWEVATYPPEE